MKTKTRKPKVQWRKSGAELIATERFRQIRKEGWPADHDDDHDNFELTRAAMSYAAAVADPDEWAAERGQVPGPTGDWPWARKWWKPTRDPIRNLVKAGALIAAEIDRLQRQEHATRTTQHAP